MRFFFTVFLVIFTFQAQRSFGAGQSLHNRLEQQLRGWNVSEGQKLVAAARDKFGEQDPVYKFMRSRLLFFQGDYAESVKILENMGISADHDRYGRFYKVAKNADVHITPMQRFESEHFTIAVESGKDELLVPYIIETAENAYRAYVQDFNADTTLLDQKIRIEVYADMHSFSSISSLTVQEIKTSGTVALCKYNRLMITSPRTLARGYRWRDTLAHELVHYFLTKLSHNKVPLWLHEGIARFQEERWRSDSVAEFSLYDQSILSEAVQKGYSVPLTAMEPSLAKLTKPGDTGLAFAQLFGVVRNLYVQGGYNLIQSMIQEFKDGKKTSQVLSHHKLPDAESLMETFLQSLDPKELSRIPGRKFLPVEEGEVESDDSWGVLNARVRRRIHIGDNLRDRGRFVAAEKEYALAATEIQSSEPTIASKIAEVRIKAGQFEKAWNGLQDSLKLYDSHPRLALAAGKSAYFLRDIGNAKYWLERTVSIHPFQPELFRLLADVYIKTGQKESAEFARKAENLLTR